MSWNKCRHCNEMIDWSDKKYELNETKKSHLFNYFPFLWWLKYRSMITSICDLAMYIHVSVANINLFLSIIMLIHSQGIYAPFLKLVFESDAVPLILIFGLSMALEKVLFKKEMSDSQYYYQGILYWLILLVVVICNKF